MNLFLDFWRIVLGAPDQPKDRDMGPSYPKAYLPPPPPLRPSPTPSGGSAVQPAPMTVAMLDEAKAKTRLYDALTALTVGITPAAIVLAGILIEASKEKQS